MKTIKQLEFELSEALDLVDLLKKQLSYVSDHNYLYDIRYLLTDVELCELNKIPLGVLNKLRYKKKVDFFEFKTGSFVFTLYPRTKKNLTLYSKKDRMQSILDIVYDNEL
jgi:hypothetical protein